MTTSTFEVTGLTCSHCVAAVTQEMLTLPGVQSVDVALVADGTSTVTVETNAELARDAVRGAVEEAGYQLL